jgi:5'-nucleotidase/UDP-sugar diphosphatase
VIQDATRTDKDILVLDAGDLLFFKNINPSLSSPQKKGALLNAQLMIQAFNLMGCDAVGIGADDLRLGAQDFDRLKKSASFPFISANVVSKDGKRIAVPFVVKNAGGLRWGIFSLASAQVSAASPSKGWKAVDPVSTGNQVVEELQAQADIIILLAAMPVAELRTLLAQLPGVTIAVAEGEPSGLVRPLQVGQTIVVCSPPYGKYLGMLRLLLKDLQAPFADEARIVELERELAQVERKIKEGRAGASPDEKKRIEAELLELQKGNIYRNELITLSSNVREDPEVKQFIGDFRAQQQQAGTGCQ